jgi:hypothetical protein
MGASDGSAFADALNFDAVKEARDGNITENVLAFLMPTTASQRNVSAIHLVHSAASCLQVDENPEQSTVVKSKAVVRHTAEWLLGSDDAIDRNPEEK